MWIHKIYANQIVGFAIHRVIKHINFFIGADIYF